MTEGSLMKRFICILLIFALCASTALAAGYPKKKLSGIVQWGAGGGTDSLMRPLCTLAADKLGQKINVRNMSGGTGSIATQYVFDAKADGYTLLLGAENPALYNALGISQLTYDDFTCVLLIGDESVGITVRTGSEYKTFTQLIEAALAAPDTITLATTGVGGLPWEVNALICQVTGARFKQIPYDSDATARNAVLSGECVFTVCKIQSGLESYKAGTLDYLCLLTAEENPLLPGVPAVTCEYPEFGEFLPWGPFYGVFVKNGTDAKIIDTLTAAFLGAYNDESYRKVLDSFCINALGLTGEEAQNYIISWRDTTLSALERCGALE